jgi:hypothetical protein
MESVAKALEDILFKHAGFSPEAIRQGDLVKSYVDIKIYELCSHIVKEWGKDLAREREAWDAWQRKMDQLQGGIKAQFLS